MKGLSIPLFCFVLIWIYPSSTHAENCAAELPDDGTWKVTSLLIEPFLMEADGKKAAGGAASPDSATASDNSKSNANNIDSAKPVPANETGPGDGKYKGYIVDLLDEITSRLGKKYEISLVADNRYGKKDGDKFTGLIGEVCKGNAHIAAAPITVTLDREEAVDFTYPFMRFQAMALIQKNSGSDNIKSLQDLLEQEYAFGVLRDGVISKSLAASKNEDQKKVWGKINANNGLMDDNESGQKQAAKDEKFAFLVESSFADYVNRENCDIEAVETGIYQRQYALAVPQQSKLRDLINRELIKLEATGKLDELYDKWWGEDKCSGCMLQVSLVTLLVAILAAIFNIAS